MAKQGTAKREAVRIEGPSSATGSRIRRSSVHGNLLRALSALGILVWLVAAGVPAAQAATEPTPSPLPSSPSSPPAAPGAPQIAAPTITAPARGSVVTSTTTTVSGSKSADTGVQIQNGGGDVLCVVNASASTTFSCSVTLGAGASITIQAIATDAAGADAGKRTSTVVSSVPPPTILSGGGAPGNGLMRGSGIAGATVTVSATSGESCSSTADTSGAWACLLAGGAADGVYSVTATQVATYGAGKRSDASPAARLVLDRTVPSPPALSSPVSGSSLPEADVRFAGTGEDGATVTVFAGSASVCQAIVSNGSWSCVAARIEVGSVRIVAIQRDAANNSSSGSSAVDLTIAPVEPSPTPAPTAPTPSGDPSETPAPIAPAPIPSAPSTPDGSPGPMAPGPEASPWHGDTWDAATPFTTPRAPLFSSGSGVEWLRTLLLAALAVAGIALAAHVTVGAGGRGVAPATSPSVTRFALTGRNRRDVVEPPRALAAPSSVATVVAALIAVAALLILSKPVDGTPAYARLLFASITATFVVALVSVAVPAVAARLLGAGRVSTTVDPRGFLIVGATAAASRLLGLEPPLLFALVLTASTALVVGRAVEGRVAAARIVSLAVLGGGSWAMGSALPALGVSGFAGSLVTETLNVLTAASLGSAAIMMLPIGASAGRSLWAASRVAWAAVGFVVVTVELVLLGSRAPEMTTQVTTIGSVLAVGCIALCASVWIWRRHVAPALADDDES